MHNIEFYVEFKAVAWKHVCIAAAIVEPCVGYKVVLFFTSQSCLIFLIFSTSHDRQGTSFRNVKLPNLTCSTALMLSAYAGKLSGEAVVEAYTGSNALMFATYKVV